MPKISAVMALYNTPYNLFEATINSILNQTFSDFELIIVDDKSEIDYSDFLKKFTDSRIKYFKLDENIGPGGARNFGIKKASGDYIAIADSDDIYLEKRFELQADFLEKNPGVSLISGAFGLSNSKRINTLPLSDEEIKVFMLFNSPFANPVVMFRKEVFLNKNLFYPEFLNFAEDYELWINAAFSGIKMANLDDVLMIYTRRANQLSKTKQKNQAEALKDLYKKIFEKLNMPVSKEEIELHYSIETGHYNKTTTIEDIINWFDKVITHNQTSNFLDENLLIEKNNQVIQEFKKSKKTFFGIRF